MQPVGALASPPTNLPCSFAEGGSATGRLDFLALLLNARVGYVEPSADPTQHVALDDIKTTSFDEEPDARNTNDKPNRELSDQPGSPVPVIDPRLFSAQPVHVPLRFGLDLAAAVEPGRDSNPATETSEPEDKPAVNEKKALPTLPFQWQMAAEVPAPIPPAPQPDASEKTSASEEGNETEIPRGLVAAGDASLRPNKARDLETAFTLRLSHCLDPVAPEKAAEVPSGVETKQTQFSAVVSDRSTAAAGRAPTGKLSSSSALSPSLVSEPASNVSQSREGSEQHQEPDRRRRDDPHNVVPPSTPNAEPSEPTAPVDATTLTGKAEHSPALDSPLPLSVGQRPPTLEVRANPAAEPSVARTLPPEPRTDTSKAAPLREITLKVSGDSDRPVDLHIVNERGKLHVEVRTSDPQLASSLRENVGDLIQKLDRAGFREDFHQGAPIRADSSQAGGPGHQNGHSGNGAQRQNTGNGGDGQPGHQQQQDQGRGNRPRWLEEIVRNFHSSEEEKENEK